MGEDYCTGTDNTGRRMGMVRYTDPAVMAGMVERTDREYAANAERMMRGEAPVNEGGDSRYFDFVRHSPVAQATVSGSAFVRVTNSYFNTYDVAFANGDSRADCRRAGMVAFCDQHGYDYPDFMD